MVKTLHNFRLLCPKAVFFRDGKPCFDCQSSVLKLPAFQHACYRESRSATSVAIAMSATYRWLKTYQHAVDAFIAPSNYLLQTYLASGFPIGAIHVKPHFLFNDLGLASGSGGFAMFVGRLSEEKGLETLLTASKALPHIPLCIIGVGPQEHLLQKLPSHIRWLGSLSSQEVYEMMGDAACVIVPSGCGESFGRVIVEAYSRGTPVICSDHGGQAELVKPEFGDVFTPQDAKSLGGSMAAFFRDPASLKQMRQAARKEFLDRYSVDVTYARLMEIYRIALTRRNSGTTNDHYK